MLRIDSIDVFYGELQALWDVSMEIEDGEAVALVGNNGAGKTTTLKTISGILTPKSGEIHFKGERIDNKSSHEIVEEGIAHVPEEREVFPYMSVKENLLLGGYNKRARKNREQNLDLVYEIFPRLKERENQEAKTLSGGEQQMLAMGRGLMSEPDMYLLDEPSLGLAPNLVDEMFETLERIRKEGITIFIVEQNVVKTLDFCDRGYVIENGKITLEGTNKELRQDDRVRKTLMGIT